MVKNNILIKENVICGGKSYVNKNCKKIVFIMEYHPNLKIEKAR